MIGNEIERADDILAARDDHCHLAPFLSSRFAPRLEAFRRKTQSRNYVGNMAKRANSSSFSETRALRFSPFLSPVGACPWFSPRLSSPALPLRSSLQTLPYVKDLQGRAGLQHALSKTFGNVAEAFTAFDRLGANSISSDELHANFVEMGVSSQTVTAALEGLTQGDARLNAHDFLKLFAWHPVGSLQDQDELLADAQRRRFSIVTGLARTAASRQGVDIVSFSLQNAVLVAIRKNLAAVKALFAAVDSSERAHATDLGYDRGLSRKPFEEGLCQISDLGLSEAEIREVFPILEPHKKG